MSSGPWRSGKAGQPGPAPSFGLTDAPHRLVSPVVPKPELFTKLVGNAFAIAVVGFAIAISLGKIFALRHGYRVDSNQVWGMGRGARGDSLVYGRPRGLGGGRARETANRCAGTARGLRVGEQQDAWDSEPVFGAPEEWRRLGVCGLRLRGPVTRHC